jgi:hypothetical protein
VCGEGVVRRRISSGKESRWRPSEEGVQVVEVGDGGEDEEDETGVKEEEGDARRQRGEESWPSLGSEPASSTMGSWCDGAGGRSERRRGERGQRSRKEEMPAVGSKESEGEQARQVGAGLGLAAVGAILASSIRCGEVQIEECSKEAIS